MGCYQVSVDKAVSLQVLHSLTYILAHSEQSVFTQNSPFLSQVIEKAAMLHELCHDVNGPLLCAHTIQLNQFRMCQLPEKIEIMPLVLPPPSASSPPHKTAEIPPPPAFIYNQYTASEAQDWKSKCQAHNSHHYFSFFNEILFVHGTFPNCLDGHFVLRPPLAKAHHAKQAAAQLSHECQF